jgi:hypothetical protein
MSQTTSGTKTRIAFLDHLRYLMVLLVVVYHSVAAYATVAPHWTVHDVRFFAADIIRELLDMFMMPVLSFVLSRWVIGRWPRAVVAVLLALFIFCLVVRP